MRRERAVLVDRFRVPMAMGRIRGRLSIAGVIVLLVALLATGVIALLGLLNKSAGPRGRGTSRLEGLTLGFLDSTHRLSYRARYMFGGAECRILTREQRSLLLRKGVPDVLLVYVTDGEECGRGRVGPAMTPEQVRGLFAEWQFVRIRPGAYIRGDDQGASRERPAHRVEIVRAFLLQVGEVTQDQWLAVMHRNPSRYLWCGPTCPVERVAWEAVEEFIRRLNVIDPGKNYRLPTEAEWEYAARAGDSVLVVDDTLLGRRAWYAANAGRRTHPTMGKQPNAWGLYDLQGNVAEWVARHDSTFLGDKPREKATRGLADSLSWGGNRGLSAFADSSRVARGGSWASAPRGLRPSAREFPGAAFALFGVVGFRLARDQ